MGHESTREAPTAHDTADAITRPAAAPYFVPHSYLYLATVGGTDMTDIWTMQVSCTHVVVLDLESRHRRGH